MRKIVPTGKSAHFEMTFLNPTGSWMREQVHGWGVFVPAKGDYVKYSPRAWAISLALKAFWVQNLDRQFAYRDSMGMLRYYIRTARNLKHPAVPVEPILKTDYDRAKEIIRECGRDHVEGDDLYVYASTRGSHAVSGFVLEAADAIDYEVRSHRMLETMEGRLKRGTVEQAEQALVIPARRSSITTRVFK